MFGSGSEAKNPNCVGCRFFRSAAKALHWRASSTVAYTENVCFDLGGRWTPGELMDMIDLLMFSLSIIARCSSSDQSCRSHQYLHR